MINFNNDLDTYKSSTHHAHKKTPLCGGVFLVEAEGIEIPANSKKPIKIKRMKKSGAL
jgi:hypothetical protein